MSIEYFLSLNKNYNHIELYLEEIKNNYEKILEESLNENGELKYSKISRGDITNLQENIIDYKEKIRQIQSCKKNIKNKIIEICKHEFVKDHIDINQEKSMEITYCTICEYTKTPL